MDEEMSQEPLLIEVLKNLKKQNIQVLIQEP